MAATFRSELIICALLVFASCRGAPGGATASPEGDWNQWIVADSARLLLGETDHDPDKVFHRIASITLGSRGEIIVADRGSSEVRVFDASGDLRVRFGKRGGGPGEFSTLIGAWPFRSDSLFTYDAMGRRVTLWGSNGDVGRTIPVELEHPPVSFVWTDEEMFVAAMNVRNGWPTSEGTTVVDSTRILLLNHLGEPLRELARVVHRIRYAAVQPNGRVIITGIPMHPEGVVAVGRRHVYYSPGDEWLVVRTDVRSLEVDTIRLGRELRVLDRPTIEHWIDHKLQAAEPASLAELRRYWQRFPYRASLPAVDRVLEDDAGYLWLREYELPGAVTSVWLVLNPQGSLAAEVKMPSGLAPMHITDQFIAGVQRDEWGREQVALFPLLRRGSGSHRRN
jgi:hypothetical protein